jgi:WD40 repeat protein
MKPLNLQGHSRPIKKVLFSDNGDMLFTGSADRSIIAWFTSTGEKFKSYAHSAAVNTMTLSSLENTYLISGDFTGCTYIWEVKSGTLLKKIEHDPCLSVRSLDLMDLSLLSVVYAGRTKLAQSFINIYKFDELMGLNKPQAQNTVSYTNNRFNNNKKFYEAGSLYGNSNSLYGNQQNQVQNKSNEQVVPFKHIECMSNTTTKYVSAMFIPNTSNPGVKLLLCSREDGFMEMINVNTGKMLWNIKFHDDIILDFDYFKDKELALTSGKDGKAVLFNVDTLEVLSTFKPDNPVRNLNTCKICLLTTNEETVVNNSGNTENFEINEEIEKQTKILDGVKIDVDSLFDSNSNSTEKLQQKHQQEINNIQLGPKTYLFSIVAGGQESKLVTTSKQEGGFEVLGYDTSDNKLNFSVNAHFGPVNTISFSQKKGLIASGSEDSSVKVYMLDNKVLNKFI